MHDTPERGRDDYASLIKILRSPRRRAHLRVLLSREALNETGYFDTRAVGGHLATLSRGKLGRARRTLLEQTLAGVVMTQLWHHIFIADLGAPVERFRPPVFVC